MRSIALDIETYSAAPLANTGVHRYAADPTFEIRLLAYAVDDGPVEVEQQIRSRLGCFPMPQHEWGLLTLDHGITTSIERDVRRCKRCPSVEPH